MRKRKERKQELSSATKNVYTDSEDQYSGVIYTSDTGLDGSERLNMPHGKDEKRSQTSDQTQRITNLPFNEIKGIQSLKKRIKNNEIVVSQTDKSSRFAILTLKQYLESGNVHTEKDEKISWNKIRYLQGQVNSHVWWISKIIGNASKTNFKKMQKNIQPVSMEVPEMVLLFKDHKGWRQDSNKPVPSRPVVSGNKGINSHLSEILSEFMEPLITERIGVEVTSTEETLCKIENLNSQISAGIDTANIDVLKYVSEKGAQAPRDSTNLLDSFQNYTFDEDDKKCIELLEQ